MNDKAQDIKDFHNSVNKPSAWLINDVLYTVGEAVLIQNVASIWNYRTGTIIKWVHDGWFLVDCGGTELVLDISKDEMIKIEE